MSTGFIPSLQVASASQPGYLYSDTPLSASKSLVTTSLSRVSTGSTVSSQGTIGALTWSAVGAPTTNIIQVYKWARLDNLVTAFFKISADVAGTAVTKVTFVKPSDMPSPNVFDTQSNNFAVALGAAGAGTAGLITGLGIISLERDGSGNYYFAINVTSIACTSVWGTISYIA